MKIKICGLTDPKEAEYVNEQQVDFIGMVLFFPKSKRNITLERAKEIIACLDPGIQKVAVVVSLTLEQVQRIEQAGFDYIQIHGEIPAGYSESCHLSVLKAFNIRDMKDFQPLFTNKATRLSLIPIKFFFFASLVSAAIAASAYSEASR